MRNTIIGNAKAVVSSKGQVVIPRSIRELIGIHAGTELIFEAHKSGMLEVVPVKRSIDMFFGRCKQKGTKAMSIEEMDRAIEQAVIDHDED